MGFSGLMGFAGGAAHSAEQVADRTLVRMDAEGVAKEKEAAQIRLEQRVNEQEKLIHTRTRSEKVEDTATDLKAKHVEEQYIFDKSVDPTRTSAAIENQNMKTSGLMTGQQATAKNESEVNKNNANAEHSRAEAKKALAEIGNGGRKPLTESEIAAQVAVSEKALRIAYNIGTDPVTGQYTGKAEDIKGYLTAFAKAERAVRSGESLPAAYVERLFSGTETEKSTAKASSDERAQHGIDNLNKNKSTFRFKDYTREEFDALPKEEQDKAINQGKTPDTPDSKTLHKAVKDGEITKQKPPLKSEIPDGTEKIVDSVVYRWDKKTSQFIEKGALSEPVKAKGLMPTGNPAPSNSSSGMTEKGNIDLYNRPVVKNDNGSISTVDSISANFDGVEVLIPRVVGDKVVSDTEAIAEYKKTGKHLGKFSSVEAANKYAQQLHEDQAKLYPNPGTQKTADEIDDDISKAVIGLSSSAVTHEDRIAGIKELMQYPQFVRRHPDLVNYYKDSLRSTKKGSR
jgi:hypothetical protein